MIDLIVCYEYLSRSLLKGEEVSAKLLLFVELRLKLVDAWSKVGWIPSESYIQ
jgi:hypothetical protein